MGVLDEIKAILSPAGAWLWTELGNTFSPLLLFAHNLASGPELLQLLELTKLP